MYTTQPIRTIVPLLYDTLLLYTGYFSMFQQRRGRGANGDRRDMALLCCCGLLVRTSSVVVRQQMLYFR